MTTPFAEIFGITQSHLVEYQGFLIHPQALQAFLKLKSSAQKLGIQLAIVSAYRSFDQQLSIWNRKCRGELPVLDAQSQALNVNNLPVRELVYHILRWSALPGGSRHHWGTDLDIYDQAAIPPDYEIQLIPEEYSPTGPFSQLGAWLKKELPKKSCPFHRPYDQDLGGVAPEPWHISFSPESHKLQNYLNIDVLTGLLLNSEIMYPELVIQELPHIFKQYISNVYNG